MARLDSLPEPIRGHLATLPCPTQDLNVIFPSKRNQEAPGPAPST